MPETTIKMAPFVSCQFLYQAVIKLCEETGEVAQAFYKSDTKDAGDLTQNDIDAFVEECADVMQTAFNIIVRCGYEPQEVIDVITTKNIERGYYNAE